VTEVIGVAVGYLVAQLARWVARRRFWRHVLDRARRYLEDPAVPFNDAKSAAEAALADEQRRQLRRVTKSIAPQNKDNEP
jgi:hypothetical protein